jgi:hypothetical protein
MRRFVRAITAGAVCLTALVAAGGTAHALDLGEHITYHGTPTNLPVCVQLHVAFANGTQVVPVTTVCVP